MNTFWRAEHAVLLAGLAKLPLGGKLLPLVLALLELPSRLDLLELGPRLVVVVLGRLVCRLGFWIQAGGRRQDDAVVGGGRGERGAGCRCRRRGAAAGVGVGRHGGAVSLALLCDRADVLSTQCLDRVIALEPDRVDGRRGRTSHGGDARRVEALVARQPLCHDVVVDLVRDDLWLLLLLLLLGGGGCLFEGRVVFARPFGLGGGRRRPLWCPCGLGLGVEFGEGVVEELDHLLQLASEAVQLGVIGVIPQRRDDELELGRSVSQSVACFVLWRVYVTYLALILLAIGLELRAHF